MNSGLLKNELIEELFDGANGRSVDPSDEGLQSMRWHRGTPTG
jgi:hypothetical protein